VHSIAYYSCYIERQRNCPLAGDETKWKPAHTAQSKATQRTVRPNANPHTGCRTGPNHLRRGPGQPAHRCQFMGVCMSCFQRETEEKARPPETKPGANARTRHTARLRSAKRSRNKHYAYHIFTAEKMASLWDLFVVTLPRPVPLSARAPGSCPAHRTRVFELLLIDCLDPD
jgi:hypothetical protein